MDGTQNEQGVVTHKAVINLGVNGKEDPMTFFITGLGKDNIILGLKAQSDCKLERRNASRSTPS
jgi:hypothetical protein